MRIRYRFEMEDLLAFQHFAMKRSTIYRVMNLLYSIALPVSIAAIFLPRAIADFDLLQLAFALTLTVATAFLIPMLLRATTNMTIKRLVRAGSVRGVFCEHELELCGAELVERTKVNENRTNIAYLDRIIVVRQYAYIFVSSLSAHVIPRDKVVEGDVDLFVRSLQERIENLGSEQIMPGSNHIHAHDK